MPVGPDYDDLSPLKPPDSRSRFPVLDNLDDKLLKAGSSAADHPDYHIRYALATCAGYAYSNADELAMIMTRMGLPENHCEEFSFNNDAMFIDSTAFLVQSEDGRAVILCYRGTSPANLIDWLTDADVAPEIFSFRLSAQEDASVHSGFYRNVRATRYEIVKALKRALDGKSVIEDNDKTMQKLEALYITGHSLGGAMAAMMAVMLHTDDAYEDIRKVLRAVYTFGQPMIGSPQFADYCRNENDFPTVIRYIHGRDIVPHLPPSDSGPFDHFGSEYQYQSESHWALATSPAQQASLVEFAILAPNDFLVQKIEELRWVSRAWNRVVNTVNRSVSRVPLLRLAGTVAERMPLGNSLRRLPLMYSFDDHVPHHYVSKLAPREVFSEFGDVR